MFDVSDDLLTILRSRSRDLACVYEFYDWGYESFSSPDGFSYDPREALERFSGQTVSFTWGGNPVTYRREVIDGPNVNKSIGKKFDSVSIRFSNVSRYMAAFVLNNRVQGMRLVVRIIPRSANALSIIEASASPFAHSIIWFVGRCDKPDGFTRSTGTISAKQDLGTIEAQIPERDFQPACPLKFKKGDCLGNETLGQKTATYQAAKVCNKTEEQCISYGNQEFFQGTKVVQLQSSFVHRPHRGLFTRIVNILAPITIPIYNRLRSRTTVGNSIHDATPYGKPVPAILGRWSKQLIPIQYQDTGETIWFKMAACRGLIKDFLNIRNNAPNFSQPLEVVEHLGDYGNTGTQTADAAFPGGEFHSKLAYITGRCIGSDVVVEDPAPDITALIAGQVGPMAFGIQAGEMLGTGRIDNVFAQFSSVGWTDNPVDLAFFIITDPAYLALSTTQVGQRASAQTAAYTTGVIKDVTNAERCLLPDTETANAGVEYKRYNSTGLIGALSFFGVGGEFLFQNQRPGGYWNREASYEFYDPDSPPTSLTLKTFYRKRYTANIEINEKLKAIDFLYDKLLTCFRGFLRWDQHGRLVIDCERPADHSYLRANTSVGATSIKVLDVTDWKRLEGDVDGLDELRGKILIGAHKLTSEVRTVTSSEYSADGNGIPYSANSTSATMTATAAGASLTGGSTTVAASGVVTIAGSCAVGDIISITIDGYTVSITATQEDVDAAIDDLTIACQLVCAINAEPVLNEYIEAWRAGSFPTDVQIYCKFGKLNFTTALEEAHFAELDDPTTAPTLASSAGALAAGTYLVAYAYRNTNGNTNISNIGAVTITASKQIDVTGVALPAGADSIDWFVSVEANSDVMLLVNNNNGSGFSINALPDVDAAQLPVRNTTGEEILRVMYSDAPRALTYADTTRATHLDGSFEWPEGGRQTTINQVKGTYREAIRDFAEQPVVINDERHQEDTGQINTANIDLSAVDNFNQASRLLNGYLAKLRDQDFFFKWSSAGEAIILEVGDVVCLSDDSGEWRNVPVRIEDITYNQRFEASFTCRLYSTSAFDDAVLQTQVPLPSGLTNYLGPPPDIAFNTTDFPPDGLVQSTDGAAGITSIRGGAIVGDSIYAQTVNVYLIKRGGVTVSENIAAGLKPNDDGEVVFEFVASVDGIYTVEIEVCNQWACNTTKPTADIIIGFGSLFGIARESGFLLLREQGDILEREN